MAEYIFVDVLGDEVLLTETVRARTLEKHPEARAFIDLIPDILKSPDQIRRSNRDDRSMLYYLYKQDILGGKWIVVVVKQVDHKFISTMYATSKVKAGELLWTR